MFNPLHIENTIKKYIGNSSLHNMPRKINCPDLTLNSYANLDQHKIKLDHNENLICFLKYKLLVKKKKSLHSEIRQLRDRHCK